MKGLVIWALAAGMVPAMGFADPVLPHDGPWSIEQSVAVRYETIPEFIRRFNPNLEYKLTTAGTLDERKVFAQIDRRPTYQILEELAAGLDLEWVKDGTNYRLQPLPDLFDKETKFLSQRNVQLSKAIMAFGAEVRAAATLDSEDEQKRLNKLKADKLKADPKADVSDLDAQILAAKIALNQPGITAFFDALGPGNTPIVSLVADGSAQAPVSIVTARHIPANKDGSPVHDPNQALNDKIRNNGGGNDGKPAPQMKGMAAAHFDPIDGTLTCELYDQSGRMLVQSQVSLESMLPDEPKAVVWNDPSKQLQSPLFLKAANNPDGSPKAFMVPGISDLAAKIGQGFAAPLIMECPRIGNFAKIPVLLRQDPVTMIGSLNGSAKQMMQVRTANGYIFCRAANVIAARKIDIPETLIRPCEIGAEPPLDAFAALDRGAAAIQLDRIDQMKTSSFVDIARIMRAGRPVFRFWGALTGFEKQTLKQGKELPFTQLSAQSKALFGQVVMSNDSSYGPQNGPLTNLTPVMDDYKKLALKLEASSTSLAGDDPNPPEFVRGVSSWTYKFSLGVMPDKVRSFQATIVWRPRSDRAPIGIGAL